MCRFGVSSSSKIYLSSYNNILLKSYSSSKTILLAVAVLPKVSLANFAAIFKWGELGRFYCRNKQNLAF